MGFEVGVKLGPEGRKEGELLGPVGEGDKNKSKQRTEIKFRLIKTTLNSAIDRFRK